MRRSKGMFSSSENFTTDLSAVYELMHKMVAALKKKIKRILVESWFQMNDNIVGMIRQYLCTLPFGKPSGHVECLYESPYRYKDSKKKIPWPMYVED